MHRRRTFGYLTILAAAALVTVRGGPAAADEKAKLTGDLQKMQGTWVAPSSTGKEPTTYTFAGEKLTVKAPSRSYEITVVLDEQAKPEKTIDLRVGGKAPDDSKGQTAKGIYKFDGEKLVLCHRPEGARPAKYEQIGTEQFLVAMTREKDKPEKK